MQEAVCPAHRPTTRMMRKATMAVRGAPRNGTGSAAGTGDRPLPVMVGSGRADGRQVAPSSPGHSTGEDDGAVLAVLQPWFVELVRAAAQGSMQAGPGPGPGTTAPGSLLSLPWLKASSRSSVMAVRTGRGSPHSGAGAGTVSHQRHASPLPAGTTPRLVGSPDTDCSSPRRAGPGTPIVDGSISPAVIDVDLLEAVPDAVLQALAWHPRATSASQWGPASEHRGLASPRLPAGGSQAQDSTLRSASTRGMQLGLGSKGAAGYARGAAGVQALRSTPLRASQSARSVLAGRHSSAPTPQTELSRSSEGVLPPDAGTPTSRRGLPPAPWTPMAIAGHEAAWTEGGDRLVGSAGR